jgi:hypothetical protein
MLPKLNNVPEFERSIERFEAWWRCELLDRPPLTFWLPPARQPRPVERQHATVRERWLDAEFSVQRYLEWLSCLDFAGDSFPVYMPNVGPELTAALYGCELEFSDHSSWSKPIVHQPEDWGKVLATPPNFDNIYWQTIEQMDKLALQCCEGKFLVGITDLHGNYDILAALRDPQTLCLDILDIPEVLKRVDRHVAQGFVAAFERQYQLLSPAGQGLTSWAPYFHQGPAYLPSSDFWCMVSNEQAKELILPDILMELQPLERSLFHLDGVQALRHLDLLLQIPQLSAVQWTYGAGQEPGRRWIDVYRRCVATGKAVQVYADDPADALAVLDAVGPRGVWLCVGKLKNRQEAEAFVQEVKKRS